jgi:hypothetical protein
MLDIRGSLSAGSIRAGSVKSDGSVRVEGNIETTSLVAENASAETITGDHVVVAQHLKASGVHVKSLKAGSARISSLSASDVEVEYDLKCAVVNATTLMAGTLEADGPYNLVAEIGQKTLTGAAGRPWKDQEAEAGAPGPA